MKDISLGFERDRLEMERRGSRAKRHDWPSSPWSIIISESTEARGIELKMVWYSGSISFLYQDASADDYIPRRVTPCGIISP